MLVNNGADKYCEKEETRVEGPWRFGEIPIQRNLKADWDSVKQAAKEGRFDDIPSDILVKHYPNIKRIHTDNLQVKEHDECRGTWLWGEPGTGKTTYARTHFAGTLYIKAQNKWWDGYTG